jgi:ComF family protein
VFAPLAYEYPVDRLVGRAKYRRRLHDARFLGELLAESLAAAVQAGAVEPPDLLVPVPLHRRRLGERGYNQALEIARPVAKRLRLPLQPGLCKRVRATPEQAGLPAAERRRNLRAAFSAAASVRRARVAIVDDVITTGSTVAAVAQALRKAGAADVQAWVVARTPDYRKV